MKVKPAERTKSVSEYYFSAKLRQIDEMRASGADVINLGIGSPDQPPSENTVARLSEEALKPNVHGYQSYNGSPVLRKAFAGWYQKYFKVNLDPVSEILPLIGCKEGIMHISMGFVNPGDEVLVPQHRQFGFFKRADLLVAPVNGEHIAKLDRDNAKPYYIMALLQAQEVTRGKQFGKKWLVKEQACLLTNSEWQPVLDLIRKGNKRRAFSATSARLPILSDVRVSVNGKPCPVSSVQSYLGSWLNNLGGLAEWPGSFTAAARARQLARQTHWQARQSKKHGKDSEAREMVQALQSFADRYATSKPRRITSFMVGAGIKAMAFAAESQILTASPNSEERRHAEQQSKDWRKISTDIAEESLRSLREDGKALKSSGCGLDYPDFAAEEKQVNALINKMGLDTKG